MPTQKYVLEIGFLCVLWYFSDFETSSIVQRPKKHQVVLFAIGNKRRNYVGRYLDILAHVLCWDKL